MRKRSLRLRIVAGGIVPFLALLFLDISPGVAAMREARAERARIVAMAAKLELDPQALLDPAAYQQKLARRAEAERELQIHWMRERTKPDPDKLAWVSRTVEAVENAYALDELAALADDLADIETAIADHERGEDATLRLVALERASLRHHAEVLRRYDRAIAAVTLSAAARARHQRFLREVKRDLATVARELARATHAKPVGEPANVNDTSTPAPLALRPLRKRVAELAAPRDATLRPGVLADPPADRPIRLAPETTLEPTDTTLTAVAVAPRAAAAAPAAPLPRSGGGNAVAAPATQLAPITYAQSLALAPPTTPDTAPTVDAPHTPDILALADQLDRDPVQIANWVQAHIDTEIYRGARKGAVGTLAERSGNDVDQASLLIALLRASGIPARYERVVLRLDPAQWRAYTGIDDARTAASFLTTAGLSATVVTVVGTDGASEPHIETPFMGVRAHVAYANYRGQDTGRAGTHEWAPIAPALKSYSVQAAVDLRPGASFDFDAYLAAPTSDSPLETWQGQLRAYILEQGIDCETLASAQPLRTIIPENLPYLRAVYPAPVARELGTGTDVPPLLQDEVRITLQTPRYTPVIDYRASLTELYAARVTLTHEPATPEDAATIDSFGGLEQTPLYLVQLAAVLRVDGQQVARGPAQAPGTDNPMTVRFLERGKAIATVPHIARVGSVYVWAMDPGTAPLSQLDRDEVALAQATASGDEAAADLARLQLMATRYFRAYNQARDQIPGVFHSRRLVDPSEALLSYELNVTSVGGAALSGRRDTVLLDVGRTLTTPFAIDGRAASSRAHQKLLLGHEGSFLELAVPAEFHGADGFSAVTFVQAANGAGIPVYEFASDEIDAFLPLLTELPAHVRQAIANKAKPGRRLRVPDRQISLQGRPGIYGFISYDPRTGGAEYSLNGRYDGAELIKKVRDAAGDGATCEPPEQTQSTVTLSRGYYHDTEQDLGVVARGVRVPLTRAYHSYLRTPTALGPGWTHAYAKRLVPYPGGISYQALSGNWDFESDGAGGYIVPPGVTGTTLIALPDGYRLERDGDYHERFDLQGRLLAFEDGNGNALQLVYNAAGHVAQVHDGTGRIVLSFNYRVDGRLGRVTDAKGRSVIYDFDASGRLASVTNVLGHTRGFAYDQRDLLVEKTDWNGNVIAIAYDDAGRWIRTTGADGFGERAAYDHGRGRAVFFDRGGAAKTVEYGAGGERVAEMDALGNRAEYDYDAGGRRSFVRAPDGSVTSQRYDAAGRLIETTSPLGTVTSFEYDAAGNLIRRVEDVGGANAVWSYTYDAAGNRTSAVDPGGAATTMSYDAYGQFVSVSHPDGSTETTEYDALGRVVRSTDAAGVETVYEHDLPDGRRAIVRGEHRQEIVLDAAGRPLERFDGAVRSSFSFDPEGNITTIDDGAGGAMAVRYDANNRPVEMTDSLGASLRVVYDPRGNVLAHIDAAGNAIRREHDALGREIRTIDQQGHATATGYCLDDPAGRVCETVDALGNLALRDYDAEGRIVRAVDPAGAVTSFEYDARGREVARYDAFGFVTRQEYDLQGRLVRREAADGAVSTMSYDPMGQLSSFTDGNGHTTSYGYAAGGQLLAEIDPTGTETRFFYDATGRQTGVLDPKAQLTAVFFDGASRPERTEHADGSAQRYEYDAAGRPVLEENEHITRTRTYDLLGRVLTVTDHRFTPAKTLHYAYDDRGNRRSMRVEPEGLETTYRYDSRNQLVEFGETVRFAYDAVGRRTQVRYSNGVTGHYAYDNRSNIVSIAWRRKTGEVLSAAAYGYDLLNRRILRTYEDGTTEHYQYDAMSRLTAVTYPRGERRVDYEYDAVGNRTRMREQRLGELELAVPGCNPVLDTDCDGVVNELDNCPTTHNADQESSDGDQFTDTFDTAASFANYQAIDVTGTSDWRVTSDGRLGQRNVSLGSARTANTFLLRDNFDDEGSLRIAATFEITDQNYDHGAGFAFRYQDPNNTYRFLANVKGSYRRIDKVEDGVVTVLAQISGSGIGYDKQARFAVEAEGPVLRVLQGNNVILSAEDATFPSGGAGLFAFRAAGARFDDVLATNADPRGDACDACPTVADATCAPTCDDPDGDGYGSAVGACGQARLDCAPSDASVSPDADELCDGRDNDCDGRIDERCEVLESAYVYDAANRLLRIEGEGAATYTYDANGSMTEKTDADGTTSFSYAATGRMVERRRPGGAIETMAYDPGGLRIAYDDDSGSQAILLEGADELAVYDGVGEGAQRASYLTRDPDAVDTLFARTDETGETVFVHTDALGSVMALSDASGRGIGWHRYDAFGQTTRADGTSIPWGFQGRRFDGPTDGYYRSRYYDTSTGGFNRLDDKLRFGSSAETYTSGDSWSNGYAWGPMAPTLAGDAYGFSSNSIKPSKGTFTRVILLGLALWIAIVFTDIYLATQEPDEYKAVSAIVLALAGIFFSFAPTAKPTQQVFATLVGVSFASIGAALAGADHISLLIIVLIGLVTAWAIAGFIALAIALAERAVISAAAGGVLAGSLGAAGAYGFMVQFISTTLNAAISRLVGRYITSREEKRIIEEQDDYGRHQGQRLERRRQELSCPAD